MPRKPPSKTFPPLGKLTGKKVAFVGKFGPAGSAAMQKLVKAEGGRVVDGEKAAPDVLVAGAGVGGSPPAAVARIQKKHPAVQILDEAGFYQLTAPTPDEFLELLRSGPHDHEFWYAMSERQRKAQTLIDLRGRDFRKFDLNYAVLYGVNLDGSDFRGATLISVYFHDVKGARFDGATMTDGSFTKAEDCSLKNVSMTGTRWNPAAFVRCDFTGATIASVLGSHTRAAGCTFRKATLVEDFDQSDFTGCDFARANLWGTDLSKCDFSGADLTGADLSEADLRNAKLVSADLTKAKLRGANLTGADLTNATIDGADFTGANLIGTTAAGLDPSKAKNFQPRAARTPGPNMRELAKVANASQRLTTTIELDLDMGETVVLEPGVRRYWGVPYPDGRYTHTADRCITHSSAEAPSLEQGMLNLIDRWFTGKPKFDTVTAEGKKCPLRGPELRNLALAAWCEAFGLAGPSAEDVQRQQQRLISDAATLRDAMLAELHGGPAGVKQWNARPVNERAKLGQLRRHDFSGAKLSGAILQDLDLRGSRFDGAVMKKARLERSLLKQATFAGADLSGAVLTNADCTGASFEGAALPRCSLRWGAFRGCNFRGADLTRVDFRGSDFCGADFTAATLERGMWAQARFDGRTRFPAGFVPPTSAVWAGPGPHPGAPPVQTAAPGSLDFDSFFRRLPRKVEAARASKAVAMLKAERFQLFSEVKGESLVGVVKSQSSPKLVYSCRLASDGSFGCCTQNLNHCGGLRGALCKHLLVLIVGLTKAGQLDPATVDAWIDASRRQKPAIDETVMTETFLRYKGAEAGEVDWRPTDTIPEDFYAL